MDDRDDIFDDYMGDTSRATIHGDEYARGWAESDEAIKHRLAGWMTYSQGESDWDRGWNERIVQEVDRGWK
jgi:hypothetical protein